MKYVIIFLFFLAFSCTKDIENVTFEGKVIDYNKSNPISDVKVIFTCWKYGNSPDSSYSENETIIVKTDKNGNYQVSFDKGAFIEVKVFRYGYLGYNYSEEIFNQNNKLNIYLKNK